MHSMQVMQLTQVMQIIQVIQVMQVMKVMQVLLVMIEMHEIQVSQVIQVSLAQLWVAQKNPPPQKKRKRRKKSEVQYPNETFLFFVYYLPQAEGKVIETEYPFGRQMGTICLLGELFIQHAQLWGMPSVIIHIFGGFSHLSNLTLWEAPSELLTDWGLFPSYTKKIWFLLLPCFGSSKNHRLTDSILHGWYWQHQDDGAHRGGGQH